MPHWPKQVLWPRPESDMSASKCFTGGTKITGYYAMLLSNALFERMGLFPSDKVTTSRQAKQKFLELQETSQKS